MRVLIFHGYMLRGTGSNVYNASLAEALARLGHEVHLLCQDRGAGSLPWVDGVGVWHDSGLSIERTASHARESGGSVTVYAPDLRGLLPVYVYDRYDGFEVKTFADLSDEELTDYLDTNVAAVRDVAEAAGGIDAALANHLVMGPAILARADVGPFAAKIHGSALEYTVKPHPRFLPYAREGMEAARGVLIGSAHTAESLWATLPDVPDLREKTRLGPPGVDVEEFSPRGEREPLVAFVGKLIVSKGVDLLLAAWPLVRDAHPDARLEVAGYGAYEDGLRRLLAALERGDLDDAREVARLGWSLEGGEGRPLPILSAFLAAPPDGYAEMARAAAGSVEFVGRLEHDQVACFLPRAEAMVMPSTFPEAFGMVAVEAAACGALPVSAAHSGMAEVSRRLGEAVPDEIAALLSFAIEPGAVAELAARLDRWL